MGLVGFDGFWWVLTGFGGFWWVLMGFDGFIGITVIRIHWQCNKDERSARQCVGNFFIKLDLLKGVDKSTQTSAVCSNTEITRVNPWFYCACEVTFVRKGYGSSLGIRFLSAGEKICEKYSTVHLYRRSRWENVWSVSYVILSYKHPLNTRTIQSCGKTIYAEHVEHYTMAIVPCIVPVITRRNDLMCG